MGKLFTGIIVLCIGIGIGVSFPEIKTMMLQAPGRAASPTPAAGLTGTAPTRGSFQAAASPAAAGEGMALFLTTRTSAVHQYTAPRGRADILSLYGRDPSRTIDNVQFSGDGIAYQECTTPVAQKTPYTCYIVRSLDAGREEFEALTSEANPNGYHINGDFRTVRWNPAGTAFVYVTARTTGTKDSETLSIRYKDVAKNTDRELLPITLGPYGRGGSLDDEQAAWVSPDGRYAIVTLSFLAPGNNAKYGTMTVFDLTAGKLVWSLPGSILTHGRFLSDGRILAKRLATSGAAPSTLAVIDPATAKMTELGSFDGYDIVPAAGMTAYSYRLKPGDAGGVELLKLDLSRGTSTPVTDNVSPVARLGGGRLLVKTYRKCTATECEGMNMTPGVTQDGYALFDTVTNKLQPILVPDGAQFSDAR